jgi:DMSO reductase family type II enzyme heme b subunit
MKHHVNLWKWTSHPIKATEMTGTGIGRIKKQKNTSQNLTSKASFKYGRYFITMKRPLKTLDPEVDIQFQSGQTTSIAFNIWNGSEGETGSEKVVSSWFNLELE